MSSPHGSPSRTQSTMSLVRDRDKDKTGSWRGEPGRNSKRRSAVQESSFSTPSLVSAPTLKDGHKSKVTSLLNSSVTEGNDSKGVFVPYEQWVASEKIEEDPLARDLLLFPKDDLEIRTKPKYHRTATTRNVKHDNNFGLFDPHVKDLLNFFTSDWTVVGRNYFLYEKAPNLKTIYDLPTQEFNEDWASSSNALLNKVKQYRDWLTSEKQMGVNAIHHDYMEKYAAETDQSNVLSRADPNERIGLFRCYAPDFDWENGVEVGFCGREPLPFQTEEKTCFQFMIEVKTLGFAVGEMEPIFGSLALYNIRTKKRLSETVQFETNSEGTLKILGGHIKELDPVMRGRHFLFSVAKPHEDIYIVLKVEKVLQGDIEAVQEPYMKMDMHENEKYKKKSFEAVGSFCKRLGDYRQSLAWSALPLFNKTGTLAQRGNVTFNDIYRSTAKELDDDSLMELIMEMKDHPKVFEKKVKTIPGLCTIILNEGGGELKRLNVFKAFDPSLEYFKPEQESLSASDHPTNLPQDLLLREVQEFPDTPYLQTNIGYVNNLYVYPLSVNLSSKGNVKNIGIRVQLKESDTFEGFNTGLKAVYGNPLSPRMTDSAVTQVSYHNRQPQFRDEIKLRLPARLSQKHHLLFTFFHVATKEKKKGEDQIEVPIGYASLPIYPSGKILDEEHNVPVFVVNEAKKWKNYLSDKDLQFIDGGKPVFHLKIKLVSSVYTQDKNLSAFFHATSHTQELFKLVEAIKGVKDIPTSLAVEFLPVIFNQLFSIMSSHAKSAAATESLQSMLALLAKINTECKDSSSAVRNPIVARYVDHSFDLVKEQDGEYVFESLCKNYLILLLEKKFPGAQTTITMDDVMTIWFVFDVTIKSMYLKVIRSGELQNDANNRSGWFPQAFVFLLKKLVSFLTVYFKERCSTNFAPGEFKTLIDANKCMGLFIKDLFAVLDRGHVLDMVDTYVKEITPDNIEEVSGTKLLFFKFDFLRIIGDYEHYIPLNFPVPITFESTNNLSEALTFKYPLAGILIREILSSLQHSLGGLRQKALSNLNVILAKHEYDSRYQSPEHKRRISGIYFQLILAIMDRWHEGYFVKWRTTAEAQEKRSLYICVLFVLKNIDPAVLVLWWKNEITNRLLAFFELLGECATSFEFRSPEELRTATKKGITNAEPAPGTRTRARSFALEAPGTEKGNSTESGGSKSNSISDKRNAMQTPQRTRVKEGSLSFESEMCILDAFDVFCQNFYAELSLVQSADVPNTLFERVLSMLLLMFRTVQPVRVLQHSYEILRSFFLKFKQQLFLQNNTFCGDLCLELLRFCSSGNYTVRDEATCTLYLLIKNHHHLGNYRRISIQIITALAKLVSTGGLEAEPEMFELSLSRLCSFALYEFSMPPNAIDIKQQFILSPDRRLGFVRQVEELTGRLSKIYRDTTHVEEIRQKADVETIADLYLRIAKGYTNTPELRVTWLEALYKLHVAQGAFPEAGICMVHIVAIISEYLKQFNFSLPLDTKPFNKICPQLYEIVEEEEKGLFNETDLINSANLAIEQFVKAEFYEFATILYKFIIPIYEANNNYVSLAKNYDECGKLYSLITEKGEMRMLGRHYRVGFYGARFGDLNGKEFIYSEPMSTHLFELKDRLKDSYSKLFGDANVLVWPDSSKVDVAKLEPQKCYLQITSLDPYFDASDPYPRRTHFDRNTLLEQFVFTTPFTMSGKSNQGAIDEQYIRKTIVGGESTFPGLLKRIPVTTRREIVNTPVENAIELVEKINSKIAAELKAVNAKSLQGLLQGSILAAVNEGPIEICKKFLKEPDLLAEDVRNKLKGALRDFLRLCEQGVAYNKTLIVNDQLAFQLALEKGLSKLRRKMERYLDGRLAQYEEEKSAKKKEKQQMKKAAELLGLNTSSSDAESNNKKKTPSMRNIANTPKKDSKTKLSGGTKLRKSLNEDKMPSIITKSSFYEPDALEVLKSAPPVKASLAVHDEEELPPETIDDEPAVKSPAPAKQTAVLRPMAPPPSLKIPIPVKKTSPSSRSGGMPPPVGLADIPPPPPLELPPEELLPPPPPQLLAQMANLTSPRRDSSAEEWSHLENEMSLKQWQEEEERIAREEEELRLAELRLQEQVAQRTFGTYDAKSLSLAVQQQLLFDSEESEDALPEYEYLGGDEKQRRESVPPEYHG